MLRAFWLSLPYYWRDILFRLSWRARRARVKRFKQERERKLADSHLWTKENWRRFRDLDDPYAEYADDDPRKYGLYYIGRSGHPGGLPPYNADEQTFPIRIGVCRILDPTLNMTPLGKYRYERNQERERAKLIKEGLNPDKPQRILWGSSVGSDDKH